jgi:TonB family protein
MGTCPVGILLFLLIAIHPCAAQQAKLDVQTKSQRTATVDADCLLQADGSTTDCKIISSGEPPAFDEAALHYLSSKKYKPAMLDGEPYATRHRFHIKFVLGEGR